MEIADKASKLAHETADKVSSATNHAVETLSEKGNQLKKTEQRLMGDCCTYISDKPITSVAIAAAAGFLLSSVLNRR